MWAGESLWRGKDGSEEEERERVKEKDEGQRRGRVKE